MPAAEPQVSKEKWEVLYQFRRLPGQQPLPEKSPLANLTRLDLVGVKFADPYHLGKFAINGEFGLENGLLVRTGGRNAAVQLVPEAGDFELEASINADGLGGWFFLLGWKESHGYGLYNVTYKTSGSPWVVQEFRGGDGIEETLSEINQFEWRGQQQLRMSVLDAKLNVRIGTAVIARDIEMPNYHPGALIVGTYDTPYGPRNLRVHSMRYRKLTLKP